MLAILTHARSGGARAAANDTSAKAATFASQLAAREKQVPQADSKRMLADGARDIDRLNDEQVRA
jgi:hypothetical protein